MGKALAFKKIFIYLDVPGLSCGMWYLLVAMWDILVVVCELLVAAYGSSCLLLLLSRFSHAQLCATP